MASEEYLASGAHRHVWKGTYTKGPRKGQACVDKVFKTGSVYADTFFTEDIKATQEVRTKTVSRQTTLWCDDV